MTADNTAPTARKGSNGSSSRWWTIAFVLLLAAGLGGVALWVAFGPPAPVPDEELAENDPPPDPRLAYQGPFRNIQPDVQYVGDEKCSECHKEIELTYREHPMGRSMVPVAALEGSQPYDAEHHNPFEAFGIQFRVDPRGDRVFHRQTQLNEDGEPIYDFAQEVDYVVGSGQRGHSYLSCRDGYVLQTPVSWFSEKAIWDLSPGFARWACSGRMVPGECLYCHANRVEPVENTRNRYREPVFRGHAIGCERCHGPGELHARTLDPDDIVNPSRLEPALGEGQHFALERHLLAPEEAPDHGDRFAERGDGKRRGEAELAEAGPADPQPEERPASRQLV